MTTSWQTYILLCADQTYYTGIARNVDNRLAKHNAGLGAKYTKNRTPVSLIYSEAFSTRSEALKREYEIKQLTRAQKTALAKNSLTYNASK